MGEGGRGKNTKDQSQGEGEGAPVHCTELHGKARTIPAAKGQEVPSGSAGCSTVNVHVRVHALVPGPVPVVGVGAGLEQGPHARHSPTQAAPRPVCRQAGGRAALVCWRGVVFC